MKISYIDNVDLFENRFEIDQVKSLIKNYLIYLKYLSLDITIYYEEKKYSLNNS